MDTKTIKIQGRLTGLSLVKNGTTLRLMFKTKDREEFSFYTTNYSHIDIATLSTCTFIEAHFSLFTRTTDIRNQKQLKLIDIKPSTEEGFMESSNKYIFKGSIYKEVNIHRKPFINFIIKLKTGELVLIKDPNTWLQYLNLKTEYFFHTKLVKDLLYTKDGESRLREQYYFQLEEIDHPLPTKKEQEEFSKKFDEYFGVAKPSEDDEFNDYFNDPEKEGPELEKGIENQNKKYNYE